VNTPRFLLVVKPADTGPACSTCQWAEAHCGRIFKADCKAVGPEAVEALILLGHERVHNAVRGHGFEHDDKAMPTTFPYLIDTLTGRIDFDAADFAEMQTALPGELMAG